MREHSLSCPPCLRGCSEGLDAFGFFFELRNTFRPVVTFLREAIHVRMYIIQNNVNWMTSGYGFVVIRNFLRSFLLRVFMSALGSCEFLTKLSQCCPLAYVCMMLSYICFFLNNTYIPRDLTLLIDPFRFRFQVSCSVIYCSSSHILTWCPLCSSSLICTLCLKWNNVAEAYSNRWTILE